MIRKRSLEFNHSLGYVAEMKDYFESLKIQVWNR
jgi:hypothetical protein